MLFHVFWPSALLWSHVLGAVISQDYRPEQVNVIPYTTELRLQVAESVRKMFEVFSNDKLNVNRKLEINNRIDDYREAEPLSKIANIIAEVGILSDLQFHYKFVDLFMALRDPHTTYELPGPHKCISVVQPYTFDVLDHLGVQSIFVTSFDRSVSQHNPAYFGIEIGDKLISVDGILIDDYIKINRYSSGGSNDVAGLKYMLKSLSMIDGRFNKLPDKIGIKLGAQSAMGVIYEVEIPWKSFIDRECYDQSQYLTKRISDPESIHQSPVQQPQNSWNKFNSVVTKRNRLAGVDVRQTYDPNIQWALSHDIGIIIIGSFDPANNDAQKSIELIRFLLLSDLGETSAILFDVRYAGGDSIALVKLIPQLFAGYVDVQANVKFLANDLNFQLIKSQNESRLNTAVAHTLKNDRYTMKVNTIRAASANLDGQAIIKPVGVFTSAECISACEVFADLMRENARAVIFGEDRTTGGTGSKPVEYNTFLSKTFPAIFKPLPFVSNFPLVAQDLRVAWMQYVTTGGAVIETQGIHSDQIIYPESQDIVARRISLRQYERISLSLMNTTIATDKNRPDIYITPIDVSTIRKNEVFHISIMSRNFRRAEVINETYNRLNQQLDGGPALNTDIVSIQTREMQSKIYRFNVRAYDLKNKLTFNTWRYLKLKPQLNDYYKITGPSLLTFQSNDINICVYDKYPSLGNGWVQSADGDSMIVGGSKSMIDSTLTYFLNYPAPLRFTSRVKLFAIKIKARYFRGIENNYFQIGYIDSNSGVRKILYSDGYFDGSQSKAGQSNYIVIDATYMVPHSHVELYFSYIGHDGIEGGASISSIQIN